MSGLRSSNPEDRSPCDHLATLVKQAFPELPLNHCRLEQSGGDHLVLMVDGSIAFRFPRQGMHDLSLEMAVLCHLQQDCAVATPNYRYVDPAGRFAGYPLIAGLALTPARLGALSQTHRHDILASAAHFLTTLHGLRADAVVPIGQWPHTSTPAEHADRAARDHLATIARTMPEQALSLRAFYDHYRKLKVPWLSVIHGDLVDEHILLDAQTSQLAGIIDFSDVALGDPAEDFFGFWAYGADAVQEIIALYQPAANDPGLLARSHDHYIRYRLERLFDTLDDEGFDPGFTAAKIDALLAI